MNDEARRSEDEREVLRDALTMVSKVEAPTPREALQITIRLEAARMGLPKPVFDCYPPTDVIDQVLLPDGG